MVRRAARRPGGRRAPGDHRPPAGRPVLRHRAQPGPPAAPRRVGELAGLARLDGRAAVGDGDAGRHHPGHRDAVLHDQHRGRDRARRRRRCGRRSPPPIPEAWARIQARRAFMRDSLGIDLHPDVLPLSNLAAACRRSCCARPRARVAADARLAPCALARGAGMHIRPASALTPGSSVCTEPYDVGQAPC